MENVLTFEIASPRIVPHRKTTVVQATASSSRYSLYLSALTTERVRTHSWALDRRDTATTDTSSHPHQSPPARRCR